MSNALLRQAQDDFQRSNNPSTLDKLSAGVLWTGGRMCGKAVMLSSVEASCGRRGASCSMAYIKFIMSNVLWTG